MQVKPLRGNLFKTVLASCLVCAFLCISSPAYASEGPQKILCRPDLSIEHRGTLTKKLRAITGWSKLGFDESGALRLGDERDAIGGSMLSRELLIATMSGSSLLVIEDASNRSDVVFARVIEGRWTRNSAQKLPVHLILIDFADFSRVIGDEAALASFDEGWAVLHEIAHVTQGSKDPDSVHEIGECESLINRMRRECGVPERAEYYYGYFPGQQYSTFASRFVRLAFEIKTADRKKKKRSWILWDGSLVGGLESSRHVALK